MAREHQAEAEHLMQEREHLKQERAAGRRPLGNWRSHDADIDPEDPANGPAIEEALKNEMRCAIDVDYNISELYRKPFSKWRREEVSNVGYTESPAARLSRAIKMMSMPCLEKSEEFEPPDSNDDDIFFLHDA